MVDLHQPLGFQLAGSVPLPFAVLAAGRHPPHARIHVRQFRGQSTQSRLAAKTSEVGSAVQRRNGRFVDPAPDALRAGPGHAERPGQTKNDSRGHRRLRDGNREDPRSITLHNDLAVLYLEAGEPDQAAIHFTAVCRLQPTAAARFNLARALETAGRSSDAIEQYREAVRLDPAYARAVKGLANALLVAGSGREAITGFSELLRLDPNDAEAYNNLGFARIQLGEFQDAIESLQRALALKPDYPDARYNLARAFARVGRPDQALTEFREALKYRRDWLPALVDLAWLQATTANNEVRDAEEAVRLALRAVDVSGRQDAAALDALAVAQAAAGRFDEACRSAEAAEIIASGPGGSALLLLQIRAHLKLFRARQTVIFP